MRKLRIELVCAAVVALASVGKPGACAPVNRNIDRYGDVVIQSSHGTTDFLHRRFTIKGPNVEVWLSDKTSPVQFHIYCAGVSGSWNTAAKQQQVEVTMQGPVRFHVVMKRNSQTQVIDGSALSAVYTQQGHLVRLLGGVRATLLDDKVLAGPAQVHAAEVAVSTLGNRSAVLRGASYAALVSLNLRGKNLQTYRCTCQGFTTFTFDQPGHVSILGSGTHVNVSGAGSSSKLQAVMAFTAPAISAAFGPVPAEFHASGGISGDYNWQFNGQQPMKAHLTAATLDYSAVSSTVTLAGGVIAESGRADGKDIPTRLSVSQLTMRTTNPEKYVVLANPASSYASFGLGRYGQHALPSSVGKTTGSVTVSHFSNGILIPGRAAQLSGPALSMVYDSSDSGTHATLQCKTIDTTFRADRTLKRLVASDDVHFVWNQKLAPSKSSPGTATTNMRTVSGFTQTLQVDQTAASNGVVPQQTVILNGPTDATITLPSLESPVHYTDKAGDRIELNLATQQLDWFTASHSAKFSASVPISPPEPKRRSKARAAR